jgi:hypothetical protein
MAYVHAEQEREMQALGQPASVVQGTHSSQTVQSKA